MRTKNVHVAAGNHVKIHAKPSTPVVVEAVDLLSLSARPVKEKQKKQTKIHKNVRSPLNIKEAVRTTYAPPTFSYPINV